MKLLNKADTIKGCKLEYLEGKVTIAGQELEDCLHLYKEELREMLRGAELKSIYRCPECDNQFVVTDKDKSICPVCNTPQDSNYKIRELGDDPYPVSSEYLNREVNRRCKTEEDIPTPFKERLATALCSAKKALREEFLSQEYAKSHRHVMEDFELGKAYHFYVSSKASFVRGEVAEIYNDTVTFKDGVGLVTLSLIHI